MTDHSVLTLTEEIPQDTTPLPEYACEVCGEELHYGGRGRKPRFCDEHKKGGKSTREPRSAANSKLAAQAADVLAQYNDFAVLGLMFVAPRTASEIAGRNDAFRDAATRALAGDAALCKSILNAGKYSAKMSLALAYGSLVGGVLPVAIVVVRELREERAANNGV